MTSRTTPKPDGYDDLLNGLKVRVQEARVRASLSVNSELIRLYWAIGHDVLRRQREASWGSKVTERLAADLARAFPEIRGFSPRNLRFMCNFAEAYPDEEIVKQVVSQIPWGHNVRLLQKVKSAEQRIWYARRTIQNGWSRSVLVLHIGRKLFEAQGRAPANFEATLPAPQSDLARETVKDPYALSFLEVGAAARERVIERGLVRHMRDFLLELGQGFAFVGNQYRLEVNGDEFFIDLLFYHLKLRCFIVIELKSGKFRPEHTGKLNFYLSAVDEMLRHGNDHPSIGILLCKDRNDVAAEYALRGMTQPMAVSRYELTRALPEGYEGELPSVEDLETELEQLPEDEDEIDKA